MGRVSRLDDNFHLYVDEDGCVRGDHEIRSVRHQQPDMGTALMVMFIAASFGVFDEILQKPVGRTPEAFRAQSSGSG